MTKRIRDQILKVRDSGKANMLDTNEVMSAANSMNLFDLVVYLDDRENRKECWHFIMTGEAEITDEDEPEEFPDIDPEEEYSVDEWDEDEYPPPTLEEMKAEAVERLKLLGLGPEIIREFEKTGEIYSCVGYDGHPVPTDPILKEQIKKLEKENEFMVFLNIHSEMLYCSMDSLLIVSKYREDWEPELTDIEEGYAMTYTVNQTYPECSEMGSIGFRHTKSGGIIRTA